MIMIAIMTDLDHIEISRIEIDMIECTDLQAIVVLIETMKEVPLMEIDITNMTDLILAIMMTMSITVEDLPMVIMLMMIVIQEDIQKEIDIIDMEVHRITDLLTKMVTITITVALLTEEIN